MSKILFNGKRNIKSCPMNINYKLHIKNALNFNNDPIKAFSKTWA